MSPHRTTLQNPMDLLRLKRSALHSHFRQTVDALKDQGGRLPELRAFLPQNIWPWICGYLKFAFGRKHPFLQYLKRGEQGVYKLRTNDSREQIKISLTGDWGTGTIEATEVAARMRAFQPDYTIHLGDVYYVGDIQEIEENCLGQATRSFGGVTWPHGEIGSFALNGNHEMYANGDGYFDYFIQTLGIPSSQDQVQLTSFFALENETWRIIGLDTGYNSVGLPILGALPIVKRIPFVGADCKLQDQLLQWLENVVQVRERPRATILLTHHQYFSAFEESFTRPARQLRELFPNQDLIWLWGHEHRFAVYEKCTYGALPAYGRCIGNGGMPVEFRKPKKKAARVLQFYDARKYCEYDGIEVGFNGFLNLTLNRNDARFEYRDLNDTLLLAEEFVAREDGRLSQEFTLVDASLSRGSAAPCTVVAGQGVPAGTRT